MTQEFKNICLISINNFPNNIIPAENQQGKKLYFIVQEKSDEDAFNKIRDNIYNAITSYNVILSGHKSVEDAYGLLKSFIDYNIDNEEIEYSDYPFFIFIENENLNKKKLYAYYLEQEKKRTNKKEGYEIDSKIILFCNYENNIKERLMQILNYYHRKNVQIKSNPYSNSSNIKIMYVGATGTGKSTMINEFNGQKISYSASDNLGKTKDTQGGKTLLFKNKKYPILNQDTEGFEIADTSQKEKVDNTVSKNELGATLNDRLHIVIYLFKNERGLDVDDVAFLAKLHELKILYYAVAPKIEGSEKKFRNSGKRLIMSLKTQFKNKNYDKKNKDLFSDFIKRDEGNKEEKGHKLLIDIFDEMIKNIDKIVFCVNVLSKNSKGKINLLQQIKSDLFEKKKIHDEFIQTIEQLDVHEEKVKIGISGKILEKDDKKYHEILNESPFFYKYTIDDIKRKQAEELLKDIEVSSMWLFWYNSRVEDFRKSVAKRIRDIYSDVKIEAEINTNEYEENESYFYKTENTKIFIEHLISFYADKYKNLKLNEKYYTACKEYNESIKAFGQYVDEFCNFKLNEEQILYDIDLI